MQDLRVCPKCGFEIVFDRRFAPWCQSCNWNVQPLVPPGPVSRLDRAGDRIGRRLAAHAVADVVRSPTPRRVGLVDLAILSLSLLVFALGPLFVAAGLVLMLNGFPNPLWVLLGLVLVVLGWIIRPRIPRAETAPVDAPSLLRLVRRIEGTLEAPPAQEIHVDEAFDASVGYSGLRGTRVLTIGLPLLASLGPQERVAILGHEIGHLVNRDPARARVSGIASMSLAELAFALEPEYIVDKHMGFQDIAAIPFKILMRVAARLVVAYALLLVALTASASLHAELYADVLAARTAGRDAAMSALERMHAAESVSGMTWVGGTADPIGAIVERVRNMPEHERERIRRAERLDLSQTDHQHPPTSARIDVIRSLAPAPALVVLTESESAAIDRELQPLRSAIGKQIVDAYLETIS